MECYYTPRPLCLYPNSHDINHNCNLQQKKVEKSEKVAKWMYNKTCHNF